MAKELTFSEKVSLIDTMLYISNNVKTAIINNENETYVFTSYKPENSSTIKISRTKIGGITDISGLEKELKKFIMPNIAQKMIYQLQGILFCEEADNNQISRYNSERFMIQKSKEVQVPNIDSVR